MRNIGMVISYDGTEYFGFQTQPNKNTIQDKLEEAIGRLTSETVKVIASGRTDAGVHARRQVINFNTESAIPVERWCLALNSVLPHDIVALEAREMPMEFHARRSAKHKTYRYAIHCGKFPDVFSRRYQFHHPRPLDVEAMRQAIESLKGEHDFSSFCSVKTAVESKVRTIYEGVVEQSSDKIYIYLNGNGFLYNMVRIIAGTLMDIGEGKRSSSDMLSILQAKDRARAGPTAEAHGLMLWDVGY